MFETVSVPGNRQGSDSLLKKCKCIFSYYMNYVFFNKEVYFFILYELRNLFLNLILSIPKDRHRPERVNDIFNSAYMYIQKNSFIQSDSEQLR